MNILTLNVSMFNMNISWNFKNLFQIHLTVWDIHIHFSEENKNMVSSVEYSGSVYLKVQFSIL